MELVILTGNTNRPLTEKVCEILYTKLGEAKVGRFADGEVDVTVPNVRGKHVVIIQPTPPPAENWIEVFLMVDACISSSAEEISVCMPYMGYMRQDRIDAPHKPISARCFVRIFETSVKRLMTLDLHSGPIQGFINGPFENLYVASSLLEYFRDLPWKHVVLVSPDSGGVRRARAIATRLGCEVAFIDKRRSGPNESDVMHVVGEVKDKIAILLDDIIDTAGSMVKGAEAVKKEGASEIYAVATHALLSRNADPKKDSLVRIKNSCIKEIVVSDSLLIPPEKSEFISEKLKIVSVAPLLAEMVRRIHNREPVTPLFEEAFRWVK